MNLLEDKWLEAIPRRRSQRSYHERRIDGKTLARLTEVCRDFKPFPEARTVLLESPPADIFKGALGGYGKVKGAPALVACVGRMDSPWVNERVGYLGEGIVLEATSLGLATCWIGGFFRQETAGELAGIAGGERVLAVIPIGYPSPRDSLEERVMGGFGRHRRRKPISQLVSGMDPGRWPDWIREAVGAARLAPSAINRQPWRFQIADNSITVAIDTTADTDHISKRLDCGIAMLHLELGALGAGVRGDWQFLSPPAVARFIPSEGVSGQTDR